MAYDSQSFGFGCPYLPQNPFRSFTRFHSAPSSLSSIMLYRLLVQIIPILSLLPLCTSHPNGLELSPLEKRSCPANQPVCGSSCCPAPTGSYYWTCADPGSKLCCTEDKSITVADPSISPNTAPICCANRPPYFSYQNCGGSCCYGTCTCALQGRGIWQEWICSCAPKPLPRCPLNPGVACYSNADCTKFGGTPVCGSDGCCSNLK